MKLNCASTTKTLEEVLVVGVDLANSLAQRVQPRLKTLVHLLLPALALNRTGIVRKMCVTRLAFTKILRVKTNPVIGRFDALSQVCFLLLEALVVLHVLVSAVLRANVETTLLANNGVVDFGLGLGNVVFFEDLDSLHNHQL